MENIKVPYHIKIDWGTVICGVICFTIAWCGLTDHITLYCCEEDLLWLLLVCGITVIPAGAHSYTLTEQGISCYILGIPVKNFRWEQVSHIIFFPKAGNARESLAATLLIVTGSCPVYKKDRQDINAFWLYAFVHGRKVIKLRLSETKDQEILQLVQELYQAPVEIRKRKNK